MCYLAIRIVLFLDLNPYIAADKLHARVVSGNAGGNTLVISGFQSVYAEIGTDDGGSAAEQTGVDNIMQRSGCKLSDKLSAYVVKNQQVAAFDEIERVLFVLASAEVFALYGIEEILRRAVDNAVALADHLCRHSERKVRLAESDASLE